MTRELVLAGAMLCLYASIIALWMVTDAEVATFLAWLTR